MSVYDYIWSVEWDILHFKQLIEIMYWLEIRIIILRSTDSTNELVDIHIKADGTNNGIFCCWV